MLMVVLLSRVMKLKSTALQSKGLATKSALVAAAVIMAVAAPISMTERVFADKYDEQIAALQTEIDSYNARARDLGAQADSYQRAVDIIVNEIARIQKEIDLNQAEIDKLVADIAKNEIEIENNKDALGDTIASIYVDDKISPLEMLASSKSPSDFVDKQSYRTSARDNLSKTIERIRELKKQNEEKKRQTEIKLAEQQNARAAQDSKRAEQQQLVNQTRGEESAYKQLSAAAREKQLAAQQAQQAEIEAAMRRGGGSVNILPGDPNKGGYPWEAGCWVDANAYSHGGADGMGGDPLGYGCRQCVSYTAYKVGARTGMYPRYWGNANMWPGSARAAGYTTSRTPRENSVGVISAGAYGHVVWVEKVYSNGTVDISQYNYYNAGGSGWGHYSRMNVPASTYDTYIYF